MSREGSKQTVPLFAHVKLIFAFLALVSCGACFAAGDDFPGYDKKSGDLGAFILQESPKFGAHIRQTNSLPRLVSDWRSKEDANGVQIYLVGNHFAELQTFLTAAFGPPAKPATTNDLAGTKHIGTYYGRELGAGLIYGCETTRDGKQFTSMLLMRAAAIK